MHPANRRVLDAVSAAGITPRMVWLEEHARTAPLAAARVDTDLVARTLGVARVERASAALVREATGMAIGGVAPTGHPGRLRTLVDTNLRDFDQVWAAGGTPDTVMALTFEELVRLTDGTPARVR